jgi:ribosomal protein L40E
MTPESDRNENEKAICPKCLRPYPRGSTSCPKCGLVFSLWDPEAIRSGPSTGQDDAEDDPAHRLWERVLTDPDDESLHQAFLTHCHEHQCLDFAARSYQAFLLQNPESVLGHTYRDRIVQLAALPRRAFSRTRSKDRRYTRLKILLGFCLVAILWAFLLARILLRP